MVSTPVGDAVPAGVVALEAMRLIIEAVGEVSGDEVHRMRQPCITKLTAHPQPLQSQVNRAAYAHILTQAPNASGFSKAELLSCTDGSNHGSAQLLPLGSCTRVLLLGAVIT